MKERITKNMLIWYLMSRNAFLSVIGSKLEFGIFFTGKAIRFVMFSVFLVFLLRGVEKLAGYSLEQTIFIFLTFSLVDVIGQFLYREVYRFKPEIISGNFDLVLTKPVSALFRSLMGGADVIDFATLPILIGLTALVGARLEPGIVEAGVYLLLLVNAIVITTAFHIMILGLYVRYLGLDYVMNLYRDLLNLGKLPVDVYGEPVRSALVYLIPVGLMVSVPARAMMGLVSFGGVVGSLVVGSLLIFLSLRFWRHSLRFYGSASS